MSPYEEEKKKNDVKHHGGKKVTEDSVTNENHNFGSVSKEIDDILGDISNSHDVKTNESDLKKEDNDHQKDQPDFSDQETVDQTPNKSPLTQESFNEQKEVKPDEIINQDQNSPSETKPQSDPFFTNEKQDDNQNDQANAPIQTPESKQDTSQSNPFFKDDTTQKPIQESQTETLIPPQETIKETLTENQGSITAIPSNLKQQNQDEKDQKKTLFGQQKSTSDPDKGKLKIGLFKKKKSKTPAKNDQSTKKQKKSTGLFSKKKTTDTKSDQQTPNLRTNQTSDTTDPTEENHENAFHQPLEKQDGGVDKDVLTLLAITDDLLGKLPEDVISEFASSEDFKLYKKVMDRYNIGK